MPTALINRKGGRDVEAALVHIQKSGEYTRQVIELAPDNPVYLSEYGEVLAWRNQDAVAAATFLAEALDHLDRMLQADSDVTSLIDVLVRARFQMWQKEGRDLYSSGRFAALKNIDDTADRTCNTRANRVRQAILTGDEDSARRITASLLESGYYEPGFIRVCSRYGFCERKGWVS